MSAKSIAQLCATKVLHFFELCKRFEKIVQKFSRSSLGVLSVVGRWNQARYKKRKWQSVLY